MDVTVSVFETQDQAVRVQALARDIVLCSWARHYFSQSASLHPGPGCLKGG